MNYNKPDHSYSLKFSLLGQISAGKSSLLHRYCNSIFISNPRATISTDIIIKQLVFENSENNENEGIRLEIWDNPGEMSFSVLAHSFRRTHAFLIVIDITDDEALNKAMFWIEEIGSKAHPKAVIVLVGNKIDLSEERKIQYDVASQFACDNKLFGYLETSAKVGNGVDLVFEKIAKESVTRIQQKVLEFEFLEGSRKLGSSLKSEKNSCKC